MYILDIARDIKKISVNEIRDFIFENYFLKIDFLRKGVIIQWNAWQGDLLLLANKFNYNNKKNTDPHNAKEHYQ